MIPTDANTHYIHWNIDVIIFSSFSYISINQEFIPLLSSERHVAWNILEKGAYTKLLLWLFTKPNIYLRPLLATKAKPCLLFLRVRSMLFFKEKLFKDSSVHDKTRALQSDSFVTECLTFLFPLTSIKCQRFSIFVQNQSVICHR